MSDTWVPEVLCDVSPVSLLIIPWDLLASRCLRYFFQQAESEESLEQRVLLCPVPTRKTKDTKYQEQSQINSLL